MNEVSNGYPKSLCEKCGVEVDPVGIGSASGRLYYQHCGVQWVGKNPAAVALGTLGGRARAASLSPEQRQKIAEKAGNAFAEKMRERRRKSRG